MTQHVLKMTDLDLINQRVIIREDLNVPIENGIISNDARIRRALPTLKRAIASKACIIVLSHLGRPTEGKFEPEYSLAPVADALTQALGQQVNLNTGWLDGVDIQPGQVLLAENVRFQKGEKNNDATLAKKMASQCDVFVMDAFASAHRAQASTVGIAEYAPIACAGPLLVEELTTLEHALKNPKRPLVAIVGGSKVSTKIQLLEALLDQVDCLIVGGGIANTFLRAAGYAIGKSLFESDWVDKAHQVMQIAAKKEVAIPLPIDVVVAKEFSPEATGVVKAIDQVADDEMILDVGPQTAATYKPLMADAATIVWNGPVGVFEFKAFSEGTKALGEAIASSKAYSIAGGGDTLAAVDEFALTSKISYVTTGGGAFLTYLQGEPLPAVAILESRAKSYE